MKAKDLLTQVELFFHDLVRQTYDKMLFDEQVRRWLDVQAAFHTYSLNNTILIMTQFPNATRVAGYRTWKKLGRYVRKGEKGIKILAPIVVKATKEVDDDGQDEPQDETKLLVGFRTVSVFDVSQTEGNPLPEEPQWFERGDAPVLLMDAVYRAICREGYEIDYVEELDGSARGEAFANKIRVLERASPLGKISTLLHEWAHHKLHLHKDALDPAANAAVWEAEAEGVAYLVLRYFGFNPSSHSTYIALWVDDIALLAHRFAIITKTARQFIQAIERQFETVQA